MPTRLPNGVNIYNATPHSLLFWWEAEDRVVIAPSDGIINAKAIDEDVEEKDGYTLTTVKFHPVASGLLKIERVRKENKNILIVGSIIAAQAYQGQVVAPIPLYRERGSAKGERLVRCDRFTTYLKENNKYG